MNRGILGFPDSDANCRSLAVASVIPRTDPLIQSFITGTTTNTKSAWVDVVSIPQSYDGILFELIGLSGDALVDVAMSHGTIPQPEVMIAQNLFLSGVSATVSPYSATNYFLPGVSPGRLWVRAQGNATASTTVIFVIHGLIGSHAGLLGLTRMSTFGAATSDSGGTSIDPGGVANTFGSWIELPATSTFSPGQPGNIKLIQCTIGQQNNSARATNVWRWEVGYGQASTSITPVMTNGFLQSHATGDIVTYAEFGPLPVDIPSGHKLFARALSQTVTDATDRLFDLVVYGMSA